MWFGFGSVLVLGNKRGLLITPTTSDDKGGKEQQQKPLLSQWKRESWTLDIGGEGDVVDEPEDPVVEEIRRRVKERKEAETVKPSALRLVRCSPIIHIFFVYSQRPRQSTVLLLRHQ